MQTDQSAIFPFLAGELGFDADLSSARDLFTVASYLNPTEAHIVQGSLVAAGIPAVVADAHLVQTTAVGGVRMLVPQQFVAQAHAMIAALERGDYALPDDADVGTG